MSKFKPGDVVRLEGGEMMTIGGIFKRKRAKHVYYFCQWFEKDEPYDGMFAEEDLELVPIAEVKKEIKRYNTERASRLKGEHNANKE